MIRRRRNIIEAIKDGPNWIRKEADIVNYFKEKFEKLFTSNCHNLPHDLSNLIPCTITEEDNRSLNRIPSEVEIKDCVWNFHPLKSPGPDGFSGILFRNYTIKDKLTNFVQECFRLHTILSSANKSFIILIPKTEQASNFNHF